MQRLLVHFGQGGGINDTGSGKERSTHFFKFKSISASLDVAIVYRLLSSNFSPGLDECTMTGESGESMFGCSEVKPGKLLDAEVQVMICRICHDSFVLHNAKPLAQDAESTEIVLKSVTMCSAGGEHSVLLRSDGSAVACGLNDRGQCDIPPLEEGVCYTQVSAGDRHSVLLRSDGSAVACGMTSFCVIPRMEEGMCYAQVSAGGSHSVLLQSDGSGVACGMNAYGKCDIPPLEEGTCYTQVSAGGGHSVLLRSDGSAVACGFNDHGQCKIPPLEKGVCYTQVSAGGGHSVLLRSDGSAVACGLNDDGQCDIPPLEEAMCYTQVSAGYEHSVLLRSDGSAVAFGMNDDGQCDIPPLEQGTCYTQVSAGLYHSVLLRSDGSAVACGQRSARQCDIPPAATASCYYVCDLGPSVRDCVLQAGVAFEDDAVVLTCLDLAGHEVLQLRGTASDLAWETHKRIASDLRVSLPNLRVVLPDGQLLASICRATPLATLADLSAGQ